MSLATLELALAPVETETLATWEREFSNEQLQTIVGGKIARLAMINTFDDEEDVDLYNFGTM